tara:strand:- start:1734 stop:3026 length:1293 start_codon:yes stop_codon:yes gene_type:complete
MIENLSVSKKLDSDLARTQAKNLSKKEGRDGYKKTKLGWIPEEWEIKKIGEAGKILSGLTYSPNDISSNGILVLRSSNVQDRQIKFEDNVCVNVAKDSFIPVEENDILICVRNGSKSLIGKNALIPKEAEGMAFGAFMSILRSKHNNYFYQLFDTDFYNREIQKNLGATINSINGSNLKKFTFPFPPEDERKAIATCLSTWDTAIATLTQLIGKKQHAKKGLLQQLLSGKKRLPGFEGEWELKKIVQFAKQYSELNSEDEEITVLSCTKYDGLVPSLEYFGRKIYSEKLHTYKIVPKGCFAYATNHIEEGSIGYQYSLEKGLVSPMYTVFKTDKSINNEYLFRVLKSYPLIHEYNKRTEGSIDRRGGLRWPGFSQIKIMLPSLQEQTAIAQVLQTADDEITLLKKKLERLKEQKKGLMQVLLTGRKRLEY